MPSPKTEEARLRWKENLSETRKGKSKKEMGHKTETCQCCICKSKRGELKGKNSYNYDKRRTDMEGGRNIMCRPEIAAKHKGDNNPMKQPEVAAKHSRAMLGKKRLDMRGDNNPMKQPEIAVRMSRTRSKLITEGKFFGKGGYFYSQKNKKKLWYRSSYELLAYKILEQLSKVIKYESEPFYIPYKFQGIERNYIPDILVTYDDNSQELIEVMAEWQFKDEQRKKKLQAGKDYCEKKEIKFSIWTEKLLFGASMEKENAYI